MTPIESALEARFFAPLKRPRTRKAGVELELPICNRREWPLFIDRAALSARLDLASVGCALRGKNEAALLAPLYRRAETLTSPAREYADGLARGESVETWIDRFVSGVA